MRNFLKGLLSLLRNCFLPTSLLDHVDDVSQHPSAVAQSTASRTAHSGGIDAYGRSKVTRLNVGSAVPLECEQMRVNYQSDSCRILAELDPEQREIVRCYLLAAYQVGNLFKSIRFYGRLFKQDELLSRFERNERLYSSLGLLPVLPTTVNYDASVSVASAAEQGLLQRRVPAAPITFHAAGIRRHMHMLDRRFKASEQTQLDTGM